eukprot:CAMPEP_0202454494 /NCGR_PEP_ID=MMETSP1360-20130828/12211_1 /ASSEMBLY_ACC=CAM_ASM_000848 /TAXON_ID=515479 /ORGANISM="Licmophora paradoxa, Strain CCMP2313" /LENGTH=67 /DNA_ID=CAMNT_0049073821 /DNA_START=476 /DNA_END=675 /DNA_ORIENTATION=-
MNQITSTYNNNNNDDNNTTKERKSLMTKCDSCYSNTVLIDLLLCCKVACKADCDVSKWHKLMKTMMS